MGTLLTGAPNAGIAKNRDSILDEYPAIRSTTAAVRSAVDGRRCSNVLQSRCTSCLRHTAPHISEYIEEKRTEQISQR